jgi:hypothetical protein
MLHSAGVRTTVAILFHIVCILNRLTVLFTKLSLLKLNELERRESGWRNYI